MFHSVFYRTELETSETVPCNCMAQEFCPFLFMVLAAAAAYVFTINIWRDTATADKACVFFETILY